MYIEKLSRDEIMEFAKELMRNDNADNHIFSSAYRGQFENYHCYYFATERPEYPRVEEYIMKINDAECILMNMYNQKTSRFDKKWGQYICDILADKALLEGWNFSAIVYKKRYNQHWQNIKKARIYQATKECDEKLFK